MTLNITKLRHGLEGILLDWEVASLITLTPFPHILSHNSKVLKLISGLSPAHLIELENKDLLRLTCKSLRHSLSLFSLVDRGNLEGFTEIILASVLALQDFGWQ